MAEQRKPTSTKSAAAVVPSSKGPDPEAETIKDESEVEKAEGKPKATRPAVSLCSVCGTHHEGIKHAGE